MTADNLIKKSKNRFLLFSIVGISIVVVVSSFSLRFYNDIVEKQSALQTMYFTLSNQLKLMSKVSSLSEKFDKSKTSVEENLLRSDLKVIVSELAVENRRFNKWINENEFPSIRRIEDLLVANETNKKMALFLNRANELIENDKLNSTEVKSKIKLLTESAHDGIGEVFSFISSKLEREQRESLANFDRTGMLLIGLCLLQIILVWLLVFRPLYSTIVIQHQKISESLLKAKSASRSKTDFLANISHEIRTPMTSIIGYAEILKSSDTTQDDKDNAAQIIDKNASHLLGLLDEILNISKIEAGKVEFENESVDLPVLLNDVYSLINVKAREKNIELIFDNKGEIPATIEADKKRLKQILFNILGNAIKFTEKGYVQLVASYREKNKEVVFRVTDTGSGISEENIDKLFKPFEQADNSVSRKFGGTGLGLVLSRGLARGMGGNIKIIKSKIGLGTTFEITVSAGDESPQMVDSFSTNIDHSDSILEALAPDILKEKRILVVDDAKENARLFMMYLQQAGATVEVANDGIEALEKILKNQFDLVLLDLQMPGMDGFQVIEELQKNNYKSPILALTAHAMPEEKLKTKEAGFSDHITKPVKPDVLVNTVASHLV